MYLPFEQHPVTATSLALVARTATEPMTVANTFREIIRSVNGDVPVRTSTMNDALSISVATPRFRTLLIGRLRVLRAGAGDRRRLRCDGLRGQPAHVGDRRPHGDGAASTDILRLVMAQGLRLALTGIAIGCALAFALAQLLRGMLFAVAPADPVVFVAVPLALLATVAAATAVPALRAARVDPMQALRAE